MKTITIDQRSIAAALASRFDIVSVCDGELPSEMPSGFKSLWVCDDGYILSDAFDAGDATLTICYGVNGPLDFSNRRTRVEAFGRILQCSVRLFENKARSIPLSWKAYHHNNMMSFHAERYKNRGEGGRIVVEFGREGAYGPSVIAFHVDREGRMDLKSVHSPAELIKRVYDNFDHALSHRVPMTSGGALSEVTLDEQISERSDMCLACSQWYESKLTLKQREFVDCPMNNSVKLMGPAGSGKTLAMIVKCLRELEMRESQGESPRFIYLTHAETSVNDVELVVRGMSPWRFSDSSLAKSLIVATPYFLANEAMDYNLSELTPVSLDGHEGRAFQAEILNEVIEQYKAGDWIAKAGDCSKPFVDYFEARKDSNERRFFIWELLNEFACVLDAEGVRNSAENKNKYLSERRRAWMMHLHNKAEKTVVLRLYDDFRQWLRDMRAIGNDQMVADYIGFLDSYLWEAKRSVCGYDAVFVDEMHLFNRQERSLFRRLMRDPDATPVVMMAYDAKQSPRDTFMGLSSEDAIRCDLWRDIQLGEVVRFELKDVFRYTNQITEFLRSLDREFPGEDLTDDWKDYSGVSRVGDGDVPTLYVEANSARTVSVAVKRALALQQELPKGRRVAVLCASDSLFSRHLDDKFIAKDVIPVTSREDMHGFMSRKKVILSTPEYVAGLQFDTVFLIEANRDEAPIGGKFVSAARKFASIVYLGASRAERKLEIYATLEHGGPSDLFAKAIEDMTLVNG